MIFGHKEERGRQIYRKSEAEIAIMRRAGHLLRRILREVADTAEEGMTTLELDKLAYSRIREAKAIPGFLGLYDFPNTLCISINEEIVHGIPGRRKLREGDLVSIDCGLILEDYFADTAYTVGIGRLEPRNEALLAATRRALEAGVAAGAVGGRVGDIGAAVEKVVREAGFHCIENYAGHGIGRHLHEEPQVYNTSQERGKRIRSGFTLAIEPMVAVGTGRTRELEDGWTVVTADGSCAAHFEHTVAITDEGVEVLTLDPEEQEKLEATPNAAHG